MRQRPNPGNSEYRSRERSEDGFQVAVVMGYIPPVTTFPIEYTDGAPVEYTDGTDLEYP